MELEIYKISNWYGSLLSNIELPKDPKMYCENYSTSSIMTMYIRVQFREGSDFQNHLSFIAFLCDNFKKFPNFDLPQGGLEGGDCEGSEFLIGQP